MSGDRPSPSTTNPTPQKLATPLRGNPFTTYRDPVTGRWLVVRSSASTSDRLGQYETSNSSDTTSSQG